jgi:hypothetical protein
MTSPERSSIVEHVATTLVMAALGLWVSERVSSDQARQLTALAPSLTAAMLVGGTACAGLVYLTGVPSRMADRLTVFWGGSPTTRLLAEASASVMAALAWSLAMLVLFRPA